MKAQQKSQNQENWWSHGTPLHGHFCMEEYARIPPPPKKKKRKKKQLAETFTLAGRLLWLPSNSLRIHTLPPPPPPNSPPTLHLSNCGCIARYQYVRKWAIRSWAVIHGCCLSTISEPSTHHADSTFHCSLVQYCSYSDHEQCHTLHRVDTDIDADNQIQTSHLDRLKRKWHEGKYCNEMKEKEHLT